MVNFKHITSCKFGEAGFGSQWSRFHGSFRGCIYNTGTVTLYEKMYDFSPGDRNEWTWDDGVTFGDVYAYIPAGKQIKKDGISFPGKPGVLEDFFDKDIGDQVVDYDSWQAIAGDDYDGVRDITREIATKNDKRWLKIVDKEENYNVAIQHDFPQNIDVGDRFKFIVFPVTATEENNMQVILCDGSTQNILLYIYSNTGRIAYYDGSFTWTDLYCDLDEENEITITITSPNTFTITLNEETSEPLDVNSTVNAGLDNIKIITEGETEGEYAEDFSDHDIGDQVTEDASWTALPGDDYNGVLNLTREIATKNGKNWLKMEDEVNGSNVDVEWDFPYDLEVGESLSFKVFPETGTDLSDYMVFDMLEGGTRRILWYIRNVDGSVHYNDGSLKAAGVTCNLDQVNDITVTVTSTTTFTITVNGVTSSSLGVNSTISSKIDSMAIKTAEIGDAVTCWFTEFLFDKLQSTDVTFWYTNLELLYPEGDWRIALSLSGGAFVDKARIGLIDEEGSLLYWDFDEESINSGRISIANVVYSRDLERVYIYENGKPRSSFIDASGKTFTGIYVKCLAGTVVLKTVYFDWKTTAEEKVMQHSNITITDFEAGAGGGHAGIPQSRILSNRKDSSITGGEQYTTGIFPSQSSLDFATSNPGDYYSLEVETSDTLNISSRIRIQDSSDFVIGLSTFMIHVSGTDVQVLDGNDNILRDDILTLPSPSETIIVNFVKKNEEISCRVDLENPSLPVSESAIYTGGLFNYPHRDPDDLYKIENKDDTNLYLDYILCGDQLWEHFM